MQKRLLELYSCLEKDNAESENNQQASSSSRWRGRGRGRVREEGGEEAEAEDVGKRIQFHLTDLTLVGSFIIRSNELIVSINIIQ